MKSIKYLLMLAAATFMVACDDTTNTIGQSITNRVDGLTITDTTFNVTTRSVASGAVLANNTYGIIGLVKDPETNSYVEGNYMAQYSTVSGFYTDSIDQIKDAYDGEIKADSCFLSVLYEHADCYGDTLSPMKVTAYELSHPMEEGVNYYSDFDPIEAGYVDVDNCYKANTTYDLVGGSFRIYLDKPYTKNGTTYANYGDYLLHMSIDHPEYFTNNYAFTHNVCPGFYLKHENGIGNAVKLSISGLFAYYDRLKTVKAYDGVTDSTYIQIVVMPFYSSGDVLQTNKVTNDQESINRLVADNSCTFIKSPAGIFTEATLPVEQIMKGHENDTLATVSVTFPCINNDDISNSYSFAKPTNILMIPADSAKVFFEKNSVTNSRTSYTTSYNSSSTSTAKNAYTFSNIGNLITAMSKVPVSERSANWNKVLLIPVELSYITRNNTTYIGKILHSMALNSVRLTKGVDTKDANGKAAGPILVKVIYSKFTE